MVEKTTKRGHPYSAPAAAQRRERPRLDGANRVSGRTNGLKATRAQAKTRIFILAQWFKGPARFRLARMAQAPSASLF
jgi:hypothetical protein